MIKCFTTLLVNNPFHSGLKRLLQLCLCVGTLLWGNQGQAQTPDPYKWNSVAIGGGGFVSAIITEKNEGVIYARTDVGGAYRFDRTSNKWIPLMDWASDQQQGMFGTESLAIDPKNPSIVYVLAGISYFNSGKTYMLRSTDYGENFTITEVTSQFKAHGNGMGRHNGEKLQVDPNNSSVLYCGTRWNGLFKSTNSGSTWSRVGSLNVTTTPNENGISFVVLDKSSVSNGLTQRMFVGVSRTGSNQNLYMSTNGGTDFTALDNPNLGAGLMPQRAVLSDDGNLYITYGNGAGPHGHWAVTSEDYSTGQVWKYNLAANTWQNITPSGFTRPFSGICVDPSNPQRLMLSTINTWLLQATAYGDRYFITTNGGTTWTDVIATKGFTMDTDGVSWVGTQAIHWSGSIEFDPLNTNKVFVTSGNGIFVNEDINNSKIWKFAAKGIEETVPTNLVSIPGGPLVSVIRDFDGFSHTDITQYSPIHTPRVGSTTGLDYAVANKNKIVRVGNTDKMYYSNDMGVSWNKTALMNGSFGQVSLSANGNTILHCPDKSSTTYRTSDNGSSWLAVTGLSLSDARPVADGVNSNKFYVYNPSGTMMVSADAGVSFSSAGTLGAQGSKIIRTVPGREGHIWVALNSGGLTRSVNSGTSFTAVNAAITYCHAVGIGKAAPGSTYETVYIWAVVDGKLGLYRSTDEGLNWIRVNDDAHEYGGPGNGNFIVGDMNVYGRVYMSTAGRGVVYGEYLPRRAIVFSTSEFSVNENSPAGTIVGTVAADASEPNLHDWVILSGNTNNVFSINSATGQISVSAGSVLDRENKSTYTIDIGVLDNLNKEARGSVAINLNDINEPPTDISLSKSVITQNNTVGAVVGNLSSIDADANSTFRYTLVSGTGSADNAAFTIAGADLKAGVVFNFSTKSVYNIRVKTTDNGGLSFEKAFVITVNKLAGLPVTNFKVKAINELCSTNNDGKITITAVENLTYKATLTNGTTNTEFIFSNSLDISSLTAGIYTLCITAEGIANYKQCCDLTIAEPQPLSVYSSVNESDKNLVLNLAGASSYQIELNGKTFSTSSNSITLNLTSGTNNLVVSTDKTCQGVYKKSFFLNDGKLVYPNPFDGIVHINMGNDSSEKVKVSLYTLSGSLAFSKEIRVSNPEIDLELSGLNSGTYIMKIKTEHSQSSSKLIKK